MTEILVDYPVTAKLMANGSIYIDKNVRDALGLQPGDLVVVEIKKITKMSKKGTTGLKKDENQHGADDP